MEPPSTVEPKASESGHHRHHRRHKRSRTRWKRHVLRRAGVALIVIIVLGYVLFLWYIAVGAPDVPSDIPR
ncbi:MAG: hypothetical protein HYX26_07045 [Acidobacteriales bacterium]|nr:hypothetical protein [Terriglobales bacterium]